MLVSFIMVLVLLDVLSPDGLALLDEELIFSETLMAIVQIISVYELVQSGELISSRSLIASELSAMFNSEVRVKMRLESVFVNI